MVFKPKEMEAAYREQTLAWQRPRLRRLVLLTPLLLLLFVGMQSLLSEVPLSHWLTQPRLYLCLALLLGLALWIRGMTRAVPFARAGVALQALFCLSCALMTRPGPDTLSLVMPVFIATPIVTAPFWAQASTARKAIATGYLAGAIALWHTEAGQTVWIAYWAQALLGTTVALGTHAVVDHTRRGYFLAELQLEQRARIDALTSLLNRRHFIETGEALLNEMAPGRLLSACFLDLDHFKRLNDEGGHRIGDRMLAEAARRLLEIDAPDRLVGRLGGEEFALLLPDMDKAGAMAVAEELRERIATIDLDGYGMTVSVGVAEWHPGESLSDLLHRADLALLAAKRGGRNRSIPWTPALQAPHEERLVAEPIS